MKIKFKKTIIHTLVLLIILSPLVVFADSAQGLVPNCEGATCDFEDFIQLITNVVNFAVKVAIAFSAVVFAYAGWLYLTSGGDEGKIKQAHELFIKVLWGFLFALGAFLIVQLITQQLGLKV